MPTRREAILDALIVKLVAVSSVDAYRSRQDPVDRSEGVVALLYPEAEEPNEPTIGALQVRRLSIRVDIVARGAEPDEVADTAVGDCHAAVMSDPSLAGACSDIQEQGIDWVMSSADGDAVKVSRRYDVLYSVRTTDDTQPS
jgi:hypothetical protein